jgi:hypothetical protein
MVDEMEMWTEQLVGDVAALKRRAKQRFTIADLEDFLKLLETRFSTMSELAPLVEAVQLVLQLLDSLKGMIKTDVVSRKGLKVPEMVLQLDVLAYNVQESIQRILDASDVIYRASDSLPKEQGQVIIDANTSILEASNVADLTAQRVRKITHSLEGFSRISTYGLVFFSPILPSSYSSFTIEKGKEGEAGGASTAGDHLLEGPQLPGKSMSQDDIDALFS